MNCVFCRIATGQARADVLYQDELVTAFRDVRPQAPTHILIIPNEHIESIADIQPHHGRLLGHMFTVANRLAAEEGIAQSGYRLITNKGNDGGQSVYHLHLHLLGGRRMTWPPG